MAAHRNEARSHLMNSSRHHSPAAASSPAHSPPPRFSSSPSRKSPLVYGDRFIPSRVSSHLDGGLLSMSSPGVNNENENRLIHSLIRSELMGHTAEISNGQRPQQHSSPSVLRYQSSVDDIQRYSTQIPHAGSPAESPSASASPFRSASMPAMGSPARISTSFDPSSTSLGGSAKKPKRTISRVPYKVLDAPSLQDDFYLNLVDWSKSNVLAVALGNSVFLWSAYTSKVVKLHDFSLPESDSLPGGSVTSVCWINGGTHIAVGTSCGRIQVWDVTKSVKVRELHAHGGRVGSLSWNQQYCLIASGSKDKSIFLQDSRIRGSFTPSRHLSSPSNGPPAYPTPQRPSHPIHSDSPDHRPHYPILSSRPISAQHSPHVYSSPQRLLASMHEEEDREVEGKEDHDEEEQVEEDAFGRYLGNSPSGRSVRRRQTLSPTASHRSSSGIPPRPPSLPGTAEKITFRRVPKSNEFSLSRSVLGDGGEDDMEMADVSDTDKEGDGLPELCSRNSESPVMRMYEELQQAQARTQSQSQSKKSSHSSSSSSSGKRRSRDSTVRRLDFLGDDEDGGEGSPFDHHLLLDEDDDSSPLTPSLPSSASRSPPRSLSDFMPRPTYSPQYSSPNSRADHSSSNHLSDLNEDSSSSSSSSPSLIHELCAHKQEVCGLRWSFDDKQLASGGNDNKLFIWNISGMSFNERSQQQRSHSSGNHRNQIFVPEHQFVDHTAAVKAIAWSPHQHGLLVSGGGTADRHMRFWNTQTGTSLQALDTGSQVCNLMWSSYSNEIVSTHGYSLNQIALWKYPSLQKIATLTGHTYRVLYLAMSPNGQSIVTGAGDETLRFWNVFPGSKTPFSAGKGMLLHVGGDIR